MKKILAISLIPVFSLFLFGAVAMPVYAQGPKEECTLVRDVKLSSGLIVDEDAVVSSDSFTGTVNGGGVATAVQISEIKESWGTICLVNTINTVVDWVFILLLVVSVALIAVAGFMWMTGGASPDMQKKATTMITAAVVGIVIAVLARIIPALITGILL